MVIDRAAIEQLIPHAGSMCLLDSVQQWDQHSIVCLTASHRRADNPLLSAAGQSLDAAVLVEYGAQAAAVHAALLLQGELQQSEAGHSQDLHRKSGQNKDGKGIGGGRTAFLGAIKNLQFIQRQVDPTIAQLTIKARCELNSRDGAIYQLDCGSDSGAIISARVVLVLPAAD